MRGRDKRMKAVFCRPQLPDVVTAVSMTFIVDCVCTQSHYSLCCCNACTATRSVFDRHFYCRLRYIPTGAQVCVLIAMLVRLCMLLMSRPFFPLESLASMIGYLLEACTKCSAPGCLCVGPVSTFTQSAAAETRLKCPTYWWRLP